MQNLQRRTAISIGKAQVPETLNRLAKSGCAAAIWQRQLLPAFQTWIDGLAPENLPTGRLILRPQSVVTVLSELCDMSLMADGLHRRRLIDDIAALSHAFCDLMDAPYIRLRLDLISSNACHKFHMDAVTVRLVCTYRGTGTQYGISHAGTEPKRIFTVPTGTPILLCGTMWPEEPRSGLLHRSPPIEGSGETRLVMVLDPILDLEQER